MVAAAACTGRGIRSMAELTGPAAAASPISQLRADGIVLT